MSLMVSVADVLLPNKEYVKNNLFIFTPDRSADTVRVRCPVSVGDLTAAKCYKLNLARP